MLINFTLFSAVILSLSQCHTFTASSAPQIFSKFIYNTQQQTDGYRPSAELIDVYLSNQKISLRCDNYNQTLQFSTLNNLDLSIESISNKIPDNSDIYQASYERIFGVYKLPHAYCIAFIKSSESADNFIGVDYGVRKVKEISYVVIPSKSNIITTKNEDYFTQKVEIAKQKEAISLMQGTFARHSFYYSSGIFDVTRNIQSNALQRSESDGSTEDLDQLTKERNIIPSWKTCDERFFWNLNVVSDLADTPCIDDRWITPITNMWVASENIQFDDKSFSLTLISRRNRRRQGPRYIKRGSDQYGDVANFVETEQVLRRTSDGLLSSFVQVRGSIPLFWSQPETWKLKPSIIPLKDLAMHARSLKTHLLDLARHYLYVNERKGNIESNNDSSIVMINLIDKKGSQGQLGRWLVAALQTAQRSYVSAFSTDTNKVLDVENRSEFLTSSAISDENIKVKEGLQKIKKGVDDLEMYGALTLNGGQEIPLRVELDLSLKNRNTLTDINFLFALSDADLKRITPHTDAKNPQTDVEKDQNIQEYIKKDLNSKYPKSKNLKSKKNSKLSRLKKKIGTIKNDLLLKVSNKLNQISTIESFRVRYIWFDYHKKCKGGNVDALKDIFPSIKNSVICDGFFSGFFSPSRSIAER